MSYECTFVKLTPLNMNLIFVLFLVVVSTGIDTPLEFLFSSFLGGMVIGTLVVLMVVVVLSVVLSLVVCFSVVLGWEGVVEVVAGLLSILNGLTFGFVNVG